MPRRDALPRVHDLQGKRPARRSVERASRPFPPIVGWASRPPAAASEPIEGCEGHAPRRDALPRVHDLQGKRPACRLFPRNFGETIKV